MQFKQSIIFMVIACLVIFANGSVLPEDTNLSLLKFMTQSNSLMQRNPSLSLECFNYYIPLIDKIAKEYEANYGACVQESEDQRSQAEEATLEQRNDLASRAENSCKVLSQCSENESAEKVFECFVEGGSENAKVMYGINADASEHLSALIEEFRLINNREYKCTNETKRQYEKDSAKAYEELNSCILGLTEVPLPTEAPVETEAPEVTEKPVQTEAPAETEPPVETEAPENRLPEEDIPSLRKKIQSRFHKYRN
ncbi:hypothetical protein CVS40_5437 [Lucilia cuprina]|nr:hypothetical protein CVS40_5437 [Lucilia cuprina]